VIVDHRTELQLGIIGLNCDWGSQNRILIGDQRTEL